ncbi:unnamed protein product [Linum trigynum]|uniref:Uncharacterized protein n=1 Tax=Linum trigynum TaxID=586398 RepID=A0AAV2GNN0_9ROSI
MSKTIASHLNPRLRPPDELVTTTILGTLEFRGCRHGGKMVGMSGDDCAHLLHQKGPDPLVESEGFILVLACSYLSW